MTGKEKGLGAGAETTRWCRVAFGSRAPHWDRPGSEPVPQIMQFLRFLFQWFLGQENLQLREKSTRPGDGETGSQGPALL